MNKRVKIVTGVVLAFCLAAVIASDACAKPKSILAGVIKAFKDTSRILEIKRTPDNKGYHMLIFKNDKFILYNLPDNKTAVRISPVHTFDIEKVRKLAFGAERANNLIVSYAELKPVRPTIRAITLRENDKGELEFLVHNYHPVDPDNYRKTFIINTNTWTVVPDSITMDSNPVNEPWSKEELGMPPDKFEDNEPVPETPAADEAGAAEESDDGAAEEEAPAAAEKAPEAADKD